jgi:hypothetical protein
MAVFFPFFNGPYQREPGCKWSPGFPEARSIPFVQFLFYQPLCLACYPTTIIGGHGDHWCHSCVFNSTIQLSVMRFELLLAKLEWNKRRDSIGACYPRQADYFTVLCLCAGQMFFSYCIDGS